MYCGRPPFSTSQTTTLRKHKVSTTIPCIKGAEEHARFDRHVETTKPAATTPYHYLPNEQQRQKTSVSVAITRDGGDTGFQGSGSMATGNGVNSGSGDSDSQQSNSEGEQLPGPAVCNDTTGTSGVTLGSPGDLSADEANPSTDEANETEQTSKPPRMDEQLPKPTACEEGKVASINADPMSPDDLLATVPSDKEPCTERELEIHPLKLPSALEAHKHFRASDQVNPADIVVDSKGEKEVICNGKVESSEKEEAGLVNEVKMRADEERKEGMLDGKTQAEDAERTGAEKKEETDRAKVKIGASQPKRANSRVPGQSHVVNAVGATAQKQQGTCTADIFQGQSGDKLSTVTPESDRRKDSAKDASSPKVDDQRDDCTTELPSGIGPCSRCVDVSDVGEPPPVPCWQWVEDTQDVVSVDDECAQAIVEGQPVMIVMVQMEQHDYHRPPPPHPRGAPHLPIEESEQGRGMPAQITLPTICN